MPFTSAARALHVQTSGGSMQIAVRWETTRGPPPFYGGAALAITPIRFIAAMGIHHLDGYRVVNSLAEYPAWQFRVVLRVSHGRSCHSVGPLMKCGNPS